MDHKSTLSSPLSSIDEPILSSPWLAPKTQKSDSSPPKSSPPKSSPPESSPSAKRAKGGRAAAKGKRRVVVKRPAKKSKWDAETIITDSDSPLGKCDLRSLLSTPMAWDVLDPQERAEILALFPDKMHVLDPESDDARPNVLSLMNDDTFRHDCASYTANVSSGRFDPQWLSEAWAAQESRKMGDFDDFLVSKFEDTWSVDLPEHMRPKRDALGGLVSDFQNSPNTEDEKMGLLEQNGQLEEADDEPALNEGKEATVANNNLVRTPRKKSGSLGAADKMAIDELQAENEKAPVKPASSVKRSYPNRKRELENQGSEDELA